MSLVERIKKKASEFGYSIKKLEELADLPNGSIRRWDQSSPAVEKVEKIAYVLNTSLDYLVLGKEPKNTVSISDAEWLSLIHKLPPETQRDFMGMMRIYLETHPSVAAEPEKELREAK